MSPEEIGVKMDALGLWEALEPFNFGVKPRGVAFPYFCTVLRGDGNPVKMRLLMLDGWQTLHDYVCVRLEPSYGFYSSPMEMPHLELVVLKNGQVRLLRHDPGYMPVDANAVQRTLATRLLWEAYGVMMRVESDRELPMRFSAERAMFARVETSAGHWEDVPLVIPDPPPHTETISFPNDYMKAAKDLPFAREEALDLDFAIVPNMQTNEARPRCVYGLLAVDAKTRAKAIDIRISIHPESGLRGLWESLSAHLLRAFAKRGSVPGEIRVRSKRVFRFIRPLCVELPFKLSLHDSLPSLDAVL